MYELGYNIMVALAYILAIVFCAGLAASLGYLLLEELAERAAMRRVHHTNVPVVHRSLFEETIAAQGLDPRASIRRAKEIEARDIDTIEKAEKYGNELD